MMAAIDGLVDESRLCSDGKPCSLASLGYTDIGLDDCWQLCGTYGPENNTYHDEHGAPVIDTGKFPDMAAWVEAAHAKRLTAGWCELGGPHTQFASYRLTRSSRAVRRSQQLSMQ